MSIDNITFENEDTLQQTLTKTVQIFAGTDRLRIELKKKKVEYVKVNKGANTTYILRSKAIGVLRVKL